MSASPHQPPMRWLRAIGTSGSMLAMVILAASMLLRLATILGTEGQPISTLPPAMEGALRLAHRVAASGVGVLAACAALLCWSRRLFKSAAALPILSIVIATVFLATIGPLTPGYRFAAVTVGNLVGGVMLLMAFWWLREIADGDATVGKAVGGLLQAALVIFLAQAAMGAAASAQEMHGIRWLAFGHLGTALLCVMFVGACAWRVRRESSLAGWSGLIGGLLISQVTLGAGLMWLGARPIWLTFSHGMLSPLLALCLVSLATRQERIERRP